MSTPQSLPTIVPPPQTELEVLAQDAEQRRARIEATLSAMSARLERAKSDVEGYGARLEALDEKVRRHRWPLVIASLVAGGWLARRKPRPPVLLLPATSDSTRAAARATRRPLRAAVGAFASYFARRAIEHLLTAPPRPGANAHR